MREPGGLGPFNRNTKVDEQYKSAMRTEMHCLVVFIPDELVRIVVWH